MVYRDLLTAREDTAFVSEPLWKAPELNPEPLWVVTRSMHAAYWHGLWHDSCWEKQTIASGIKYLMYLISGPVREEHQIQQEHRSGAQAWAFTGGAAASLLPADVLWRLRSTLNFPNPLCLKCGSSKGSPGQSSPWRYGADAHRGAHQWPIFCAVVCFFA